MEEFYFMFVYLTPILSLCMHELYPSNEYYKSMYKLSSAFVLLHHLTENITYVFLLSLFCFYELMFSYDSMYVDLFYYLSLVYFLGAKSFELFFQTTATPKEDLEVSCLLPLTDCVGQ